MNPTESVRVALRALGTNKLRAALTMLGMIIGVGSVIALLAIGQGVQASVAAQIGGLGSNLLFVAPGATTRGGVQGQAGSAATLTAEDATAILASGRVPEAVAVAPESARSAQLVANGQNTNTRVLGVTPDYQSVRGLHLGRGDFISPEQLAGRSLVAVIGPSTAATLFGADDPIGQTVRTDTVPLRVIGVLEPRGAGLAGNQDDVLLVPLTTAQSRLGRTQTAGGGQAVSQIYVQLSDGTAATAQAATEHTTVLLRERHRVATDDFTIRSQQDLLATAGTISGILTVFLGAVAGISLVVGGIGIMNIMLVSVTERTREIGIRKAIGAKRRDILTQFLIEAVVVSVAGGALGILLGAGGAHLLNGLPLGGQALQTVVSADAVTLAVAVSAAVGLFFGVYPAVRASRLNPIQALRAE
ncbi:MAG TPA: ABC transporter permease [Chloroflexota bacterium]|jgi:putative ABC transport system permease protein|nr:ABC transporter permease [Chloroflexota bacterium]